MKSKRLAENNAFPNTRAMQIKDTFIKYKICSFLPLRVEIVYCHRYGT